MYLEISGRRSGKTTRLIEAAEESLRLGENPVIFVPLGGMVHHYTTSVPVQKYYRGSSARGRKPFFDECFLYKEITIPILDDGYYVGTPPWDPEMDVVGRFIEAQPYYAKYAVQDYLLRDLDKSMISEDTFKSEYLGNFK